MSKKIYVLQKELPGIPAGAIFEENAFGNYNCMGKPNFMYDGHVVENNETWFKLYVEAAKPQEKKWTDDDMLCLILFQRTRYEKGYTYTSNSRDRDVFKDFLKAHNK